MLNLSRRSGETYIPTLTRSNRNIISMQNIIVTISKKGKEEEQETSWRHHYWSQEEWHHDLRSRILYLLVYRRLSDVFKFIFLRYVPEVSSKHLRQGGAVVLHDQQVLQEGSGSLQGWPAICQVRDRRLWERGTYLEICQRRSEDFSQNWGRLEWKWRRRDTEKEREIFLKTSFNLSSLQFDLAAEM